MYKLGWTYPEILETPFEHIIIAIKSYQEKEKSEYLQTISILNHIRGAVGHDPIEIDLYDDNSRPHQNKKSAKDLIDKIARKRNQ